MAVYLEPYDMFRYFISLKNHFTTENYDFIKYNGKTTVSYEAFEKRRDNKMFRLLSKHLPKQDAVPFLISQFINYQVFNVSSILENPMKSQKIYLNWKERISDLLKTYDNDLTVIAKRANGSWKNAVVQLHETDYPLIFKLVMSNEISPETYSFLDDLFQQTKRNYNGLEYDNLFNFLNLKYRKYRAFLNKTTDEILSHTPKDLNSLL